MEKPIILLEVPEYLEIKDSVIDAFKESMDCDHLIIRGTKKEFIDYLIIHKASTHISETKFKTLEELL